MSRGRSRREGIVDALRLQRSQLLSAGAHCEECGTTDALVLDADGALVLCADHAARRSGRKEVERHHLGRRGWDIVLDLTPNWHRILSALQRMRKGATRGPTAELLDGIADLIHAIADHMRHLETRDAQAKVKAIGH
jgi:hypothetical protein